VLAFVKVELGEKQRVHTIVHLLPSSSFLGGFFTRMLSGLGFFPGAGLLPLTGLSPSGTVEPARSEGFLCVISDLSTLRRPLVTDSPLLSSEKTAPSPPAAGASGAAACSLILRTGGGPGGGGGGGPPAPGGGGGAGVEEEDDSASRLLMTSFTGWPFGFQGMPLGKYSLTYSARSRKTW
jgi:hypothetical protein